LGSCDVRTIITYFLVRSISSLIFYASKVEIGVTGKHVGGSIWQNKVA
jgi:hypothetical protein